MCVMVLLKVNLMSTGYVQFCSIQAPLSLYVRGSHQSRQGLESSSCKLAKWCPVVEVSSEGLVRHSRQTLAAQQLLHVDSKCYLPSLGDPQS